MRLKNNYWSADSKGKKRERRSADRKDKSHTLIVVGVALVSAVAIFGTLVLQIW